MAIRNLKLTWSLFIAISLAIGMLTVWLLSYRPCQEMERPLKVPTSAVWSGGCDGGNWVEYVSTDLNGSHRFKIYRDYDGFLQVDAKFKSDSCFTEKDFSNTLYINGDIIVVANGKADCTLRALEKPDAGM